MLHLTMIQMSWFYALGKDGVGAQMHSVDFKGLSENISLENLLIHQKFLLDILEA